MPETLLASGEEETFDQVALHEVAHIERGDDWALLI
ncbi:MAG: beta-lactamase regulating signal transducer with metallopeptidase domain, partial [Rhodothermales bacterium]